MDVVTVGHPNVWFNEAGCLKMKNLVDFSGICHPNESGNIFYRHIQDNGYKTKGVNRSP